MEKIYGHENVFFDSASNFQLNKLNEKAYLKKFFFLLKKNMGEDFYKFSFYSLFSSDTSVIPYSSTLSTANKILLWFSDELGSFPQHLSNKYLIIFKSHIDKEDLNVYSIPLGYVNEFESEEDKKGVQKDITIFFAGNLNNNREQLYELLFFKKFILLSFLKIFPATVLKKIFKILNIKNLSTKNNVFLFSNAFKTGLEYETYFNYLLRSKYILCPRGFYRSETFRHIEALKSGGVVISEKMPDVSIYRGNPFLTYNNYNELKQILWKIEKNEYDFTGLTERHKNYYENNLWINAVANRISEICKKHLK